MSIGRLTTIAAFKKARSAFAAIVSFGDNFKKRDHIRHQEVVQRVSDDCGAFDMSDGDVSGRTRALAASGLAGIRLRRHH